MTMIPPTFESFYQEYIAAKRVKKYHQMMDYIIEMTGNKKDPKFVIIREYDEDQVEKYLSCNECSQIAISMCLKSLSRDRADELCAKLFPDYSTKFILDKSYDEGNVPTEHIVYGYDMLARGENGGGNSKYRVAMKRFDFNEDQVMNLINELTLVELANLQPKIEYVTYQIVPLS